MTLATIEGMHTLARENPEGMTHRQSNLILMDDRFQESEQDHFADQRGKRADLALI